MDSLDVNEQNAWIELIHIRRIKVSHDTINFDVPRRLVKIKSSKNTDGNMTDPSG